MTATPYLALVQADPLLAQAQHLAWAQMITAAAVLLILVMVGVVSIMAFRALRTTNQLLHDARRTLERLSPRVEPLLTNISRMSDEAADISREVRRRTERVLQTADHLNRSLRQVSDAAEVRIREFAAVVDVVRAEAEEILLDTAATARGIHATAEALRSRRSPPALPERSPAGIPEPSATAAEPGSESEPAAPEAPPMPPVPDAESSPPPPEPTTTLKED